MAKDNHLFKALIFGLIAIPMLYMFNRLEIIVSESLDHRFFWKVDGAPKKGEYITFSLTHPLIGVNETRLTKKLVCWQGDLLIIKDRDFFCNGKFIGKAKMKSTTGKPLPIFKFSGEIPQGMAFASGSHVDSFDSRYWGLLNLKIGSIQRLHVL